MMCHLMLLLSQALLLLLLLKLQPVLLATIADHVSAWSAPQSRRKVRDVTLAIRTPRAMHAGLFAQHSVATWTLNGDKTKKEVGSLEPGNCQICTFAPAVLLTSTKKNSQLD